MTHGIRFKNDLMLTVEEINGRGGKNVVIFDRRAIPFLVVASAEERKRLGKMREAIPVLIQ